jgi:hypothetical protein
LRVDGGFEDREDHQAPFTLQETKAEKLKNGKAESEPDWRLLCFFNCGDHGIEIRPIAGIEFGMKELSICADLKSAAARRNESERFNALSEFENFGRQTDGLGRVVSNYAVFDRDVGFHVSSFPKKRVRGTRDTVKLCGLLVVS